MGAQAAQPKQLKHLEINLATEAIEQAENKTARLLSRITGNDSPESEKKAEVTEPCLQAVLENTPDQIRRKIEVIMGTLNDIESVLF